MRVLLSGVFLVMLTSLFSCTEPFYSSETQKQQVLVPQVQSYAKTLCANMTLLKPKVDLLFVIDNSNSAQYFMDSKLKEQILNTVNLISDNYDYHAYIVPLYPINSPIDQTDPQVSQYKLLTNNLVDLPLSVQSLVVQPEELDFFPPPQVNNGNKEFAFYRINHIIRSNISNGIFRQHANTIVVSFSNLDDNSSTTSGGQSTTQNFYYFLEQLKELTSKYAIEQSTTSPLNSINLRWLSISAFADNCKPYYKMGRNYMNMSTALHNFSKDLDFSYGSGTRYDSFDLCSEDFTQLFSYVSQSIEVITQPHTYDWWPVEQNSELTIDPDNIEVTKIRQNGTHYQLDRNTTNGFEFDPQHKNNHNIRLLPPVTPQFPAEEYSGYFIRLFGNAQVTFPECLIVKTHDPQKYYNHLVIQRDPDLSQTKILKNGQELSQSNSNGWQYLGYMNSVNTRIKAANDPTPYSPGEYQTGYAFRFYGDAIFTNEDIIEIYFKPKIIPQP